MKKTLFLLLLINASLFAQELQNSNWYFGNTAGINFDNTTLIPSVITDGVMNTIEGCASVSNTNGNLLFYTDGNTVWNSEHNVMTNGTGIGGDSNTTQSSVIVPHPGNADIFYIVTANGISSSNSRNGFNYSEIDISAGLGNVTSKRQYLYYYDNGSSTRIRMNNSDSEKLTTHYDSASNSIWVVLYDNQKMLSFKVDENGLNDEAIINTPITVTDIFDNTGAMKISPDGTKLIFSSNFNSILYDFDANSGVISNGRTSRGLGSAYGVEFSPDSKYLYYTGGQDGLKQIDISGVLGNSTLIASGAFHSLQLGVDDKIYVAKNNGDYLGVINAPNSLGSLSNFVQNGVYLGKRTSRLGLPQKVAKIPVSTCDNDNREWPKVFCEADPKGNTYLSIYPDPFGNVYVINNRFSKITKYGENGNLIWISDEIISRNTFIIDNNGDMIYGTSSSLIKRRGSDFSLIWEYEISGGTIIVDPFSQNVYIKFSNMNQGYIRNSSLGQNHTFITPSGEKRTYIGYISSDGNQSDLKHLSTSVYSTGCIPFYALYSPSLCYYSSIGLTVKNDIITFSVRNGEWNGGNTNTTLFDGTIANGLAANNYHYLYDFNNNNLQRFNNPISGSISNKFKRGYSIGDGGLVINQYDYSSNSTIAIYTHTSPIDFLYYDKYDINDENIYFMSRNGTQNFDVGYIKNGVFQWTLHNDSGIYSDVGNSRSGSVRSRNGTDIYIESPFNEDIIFDSENSITFTGSNNTNAFISKINNNLTSGSYDRLFGLEKKLELLIYPNPTQNNIAVKIIGENTVTGKIELITSFGKKIDEKQYVKEKVIFNLSKQPIGIYIVKFTDNNGNYIIKKILKY
ncbi:MAG: T9SS type A sorting domain-containing protein [Urechidicola sp.]|nr:T9SS type A sorting domain-containing protein [Urechidicola sp.]